MSIAFNCAECGAPLKVADTFAGKRCKCPKCSVVNTVPADDEEEAVEEEAEAPRKGKKAAIATEPAKGKKKAKPADDAEEPEESGGADNGAAEGDKPRKGKGKKKAKKGGSKKGLLLGGVAVVLFLGCLGCGGLGGFGAWWFGWFSSTPDEFKYLPTGTQTVSVDRVDKARNSQFYKDMQATMGGKSEFDNFEKQFGLTGTNVERRVTGGSRGANAENVTIFRTKSAVQASDLLTKFKQDDAKLEYSETKVGKYTINEPKSAPGVFNFKQAFCVVDSKTVLFGQAKTLQSVLERDKMPEFSANMQAALKKADFSKTSTNVIDYGDGKEVGGGGFMLDFGIGKSGQLNWSVTEADAGTDLKIHSVYVYKDSASAADAKKDWDAKYEKEKNGALQKEALKEVQVSSSAFGNTFTVDGKITSKFFAKMFGK